MRHREFNETLRSERGGKGLERIGERGRGYVDVCVVR